MASGRLLQYCHELPHPQTLIFSQFVHSALQFARSQCSHWTAVLTVRKPKNCLEKTGRNLKISLSLRTQNGDNCSISSLMVRWEGTASMYIRKINFTFVLHTHTFTLLQARRLFLRFSSTIVSLVDWRIYNE